MTKTYEFLLWLLPKAEKFPRSYRFSVGERLVSSGLDLVVALLDAAYDAYGFAAEKLKGIGRPCAVST